MIIDVVTKCSRCNGTGQVAPFGTCFKCNGRGAAAEYKKVAKILRKRAGGPVRVLSLRAGASVETFAASERVLDGLRQLAAACPLASIEVDGWTWAR